LFGFRQATIADAKDGAHHKVGAGHTTAGRGGCARRDR
jgi:hypothetical protein